jgi:hypothetical protein
MRLHRYFLFAAAFVMAVAATTAVALANGSRSWHGPVRVHRA